MVPRAVDFSGGGGGSLGGTVTRYSLAPRRGLSTGRGGLLSLLWPSITLALAFGAMQGTVSAITEQTTPATAALLMLMALPTMALFLALDLSPQIAAVAAAATALPLWFFLGTRLAATATSWRVYWRRYIIAVVGWAVLAIVLLAIAASLG